MVAAGLWLDKTLVLSRWRCRGRGIPCVARKAHGLIVVASLAVHPSDAGYAADGTLAFRCFGGFRSMSAQRVEGQDWC
jgi:hypothetical protein